MFLEEFLDRNSFWETKIDTQTDKRTNDDQSKGATLMSCTIKKQVSNDPTLPILVGNSPRRHIYLGCSPLPSRVRGVRSPDRRIWWEDQQDGPQKGAQLSKTTTPNPNSYQEYHRLNSVVILVYSQNRVASHSIPKHLVKVKRELWACVVYKHRKWFTTGILPTSLPPPPQYITLLF